MLARAAVLALALALGTLALSPLAEPASAFRCPPDPDDGERSTFCEAVRIACDVVAQTDVVRCVFG